jgi:hypothetical protein
VFAEEDDVRTTDDDGRPAPEVDPAPAPRTALAAIPYPGLTRDLASFGTVSHLRVCNSQVKVTLAVPMLGCVPFDHAGVEKADAGTPPERARPGSAVTHRFAAVAQRIAAAHGYRQTDTAVAS